MKTVTISDKAHTKLKEYCRREGYVMGYFLEKLIFVYTRDEKTDNINSSADKENEGA